MDRIRQIVCLACVGLVAASSTSVLADEGEIPICKLGLELRVALGFGPDVLAAMEVDADTHTSIIAVSWYFCQENRETVEPLLETVRTVGKNAFRQYELGGDVATTDQTLTNAIDSLASACSNVITDMDGELSAEQKTLRGHVADNRLLDVRICLLDLTGEQRSTLRAAQRTRDLVIRHHKQRKDLAAVKDAHEAFEDAVAETLTTEQWTQYESLTDALLENMADAMAREQTSCED